MKTRIVLLIGPRRQTHFYVQYHGRHGWWNVGEQKTLKAAQAEVHSKAKQLGNSLRDYRIVESVIRYHKVSR